MLLVCDDLSGSLMCCFVLGVGSCVVGFFWFLLGITFLFCAMPSYMHLVQSPACPRPQWCQRARGSVPGARRSLAEEGAVHMASSRVGPASASGAVGTEEARNSDSYLV